MDQMDVWQPVYAIRAKLKFTSATRRHDNDMYTFIKRDDGRPVVGVRKVASSKVWANCARAIL